MITILVVDDEPDLEALVLQRFRKQIRDGELAFLFAHDGMEALELVAQHSAIDVVLSDINMPRMDGLVLLERLQESAEPLSTVIVSAYGDMANIRTAMNRGAFDFVTKPIDFKDLQTTIDKTLRHITRIRDARQRQLEAERAHTALSRYFSPNLADRLAADSHHLNVGGERREITSMFTDITGFTTLVESLDPGSLAPLLNEYLIGMTDIVFEHEGTVAKIVGDALHVLFGAPGDQVDHASRAVACALALDGFSQAFRARWSERGIDLGTTRIGAHTGHAIVGNFGGGRFFDYTAYGDTINTAARLESANKQLGIRLCVSADVVAHTENFVGRPIGDLLLRGKTEPLRAYEPMSAEQLAEPATALYQEAFAKLEQNDKGAIAAFAALVGQRSEDGLASFHLRRLLNGESGTNLTLS